MQKLLALLMLATDIAGGSPAPDNNSAGEAPIPSEQLRGSEKHDIPATPYDEMVENGRVRDTDGILSDGENAGG